MTDVTNWQLHLEMSTGNYTWKGLYSVVLDLNNPLFFEGPYLQGVIAIIEIYPCMGDAKNECFG